MSVIDHYFHLLASVLINSTTGDVLCRENVVLTSFVHLRSVQYPAGLELQACIANSPSSSCSPHFRKKVREIPQKTTDLAYPSQIRTFRWNHPFFVVVTILLIWRCKASLKISFVHIFCLQFDQHDFGGLALIT